LETKYRDIECKDQHYIMTSSNKEAIEDGPAFPPANATTEEEQSFYKTDQFRMRSMKVSHPFAFSVDPPGFPRLSHLSLSPFHLSQITTPSNYYSQLTDNLPPSLLHISLYTHIQIVPCSKRFTHDWTECPYAHPQEKARRRDPRLYNYTGIACPSMKKEGACAFGDHCPYAHNVFEYWLHPTRYRTQLCNDGTNCHRKICFFAHSLDELRVPACKPFVSPESLAGAAASAATDTELQQQQQQQKATSPSGMMFAPPPQQQHHADGVGVRESLDVLLSASPTVIHSPENFSQHAARMATPFEAPAESTRFSSGSATSYASSEAAAAAGKRARSPATAAEKITTASASGGERVLSSQEEQVVDMVTNMLAQDRLSAVQAASILQQMLPESSLATLQTRLLGGGATPSSPGGGALLHQQQQQQQHQSFAAVAATSLGGGGQKDLPQQMDARESLDSGRSSFDRVMMMSENGGGGTPRKSYDTMMVTDVAPPPAHPQYWLQQQQTQQHQPPDHYNPQPMQPMQQSSLFPVPEAFPMINVPRRSFNAGPGGTTTTTTTTNNNNGLRKSTGSIDLDLPPFPGAGGAGFLTKEGLDREFGRLGFDKIINHTTGGGGGAYGGNDNGTGNTEPEQGSNPFASILYESPSGGQG